MRKSTLSKVILLLASTIVVVAFAAGRKDPGERPGGPKQFGRQPAAQRYVDVVIALDTSGSMDGLIDSARQKLWDVVSVFEKAQPRPILRVGLISYGNDGHGGESGWVRKESDLTTDLDGIYAKLFALRTGGGTEYVARAVDSATTQMEWARDKDALKIVFVAGNEAANQDPKIPLAEAVGRARERGIFVNSIYCGQDGSSEASAWRQVASLGGGQYASIDQNHVFAVATPMDGELSRLSLELNKTYLGYGTRGREGLANQALQDSNASGAGIGVAASRAKAKAGKMYRASEWDLVDAVKDGKVAADKLEEAALPEPMKAMAPAERQAFVEKKAKERESIQKQIAELAQKRDVFIQGERKKNGPAGAKSLDDALTGALQKQAEQKGFAF